MLVISFTLFITYGSFLSWYFLLPLHLRNLGASEIDIGTSYIFLDLSVCILQVVGGYLSDRIGRKKLITIPTFIIPLLFAAAATSNSWKFVVFMISLANLTSGLQTPSIYSMIAESVEEKDRGLAFGIFEISAAAAFAGGLGLGSILTHSSESIKTLLLICSVLTMTSAVIRQFWLKDVIKHEEFNLKIHEITNDFNKNILYLLLAFIFYQMMLNATIYGPFLTLYAKDAIKLSPRAIQIMLMSGGLFAIFFNLANGKITQKIGSKMAMIAGCLGHAFLFIPWLFTVGPVPAIITYIPTYLFLQLSFIGHDTIMSDLTVIRTRSSMIGILGMVSGIIGALSPGICSRLTLNYGQTAPFFAGVVFAVITVILLVPIKCDKN